MCNLYSITKGQEAIRRLFEIQRDLAGNLPPLPGVYPDAMAPVVSLGRDGARELGMMRWGFPPPPNLGRLPVTNVRNAQSAYWRGWLKPPYRCLVPATSFCEWEPTVPKKTPVWFAQDDSRPVFAFAGIWRPWTGLRGTRAAPVEGEHRLFAFLTTEPNALVRPIHPKSMPVILTTPQDCAAWLEGSLPEALALQRPLPDDALRIVLRGEKEDAGGAPASGVA